MPTISQPTPSDLPGLTTRNHRTHKQATEGSHRPILPVARKPGTPETLRAIFYGATSRDTSAIRTSQGGVASIQSLPVSLLTSPSNILVSTRSAKASPSPLLHQSHWPSHRPRRAVLYALVLYQGVPVCFHSGHERINLRTRSLSSSRAELSV